MDKYKWADKYLNKSNNKTKKFFVGLLNKILICVLLLLVGLVVLKLDSRNGSKIHKYLYENNISFAKVNELYQKYIGDILPFQSIKEENVTPVFNEELKYENVNIYKDGAVLEVSSNYLVPLLNSGIVVFSGEKDGYGNTVIVQQVDGVNVWYGNLSNINVNLYDYVSKGEFLAEADKKLYLLFQKDEEFLDYKEYIK